MSALISRPVAGTHVRGWTGRGGGIRARGPVMVAFGRPKRLQMPQSQSLQGVYAVQSARMCALHTKHFTRCGPSPEHLAHHHVAS